MTKILRSILIALLISSSPALAKTKGEVWRYEGPRIGVDISRFLLPVMSTANRTGWELQADIPYKGNLFPTFETGMQWFDDKHDAFHYKNSGVYGRLGVDMSIVKFESLKDHDFMFVGFRYGYAIFNQQTDSITTSNYWGSRITSLDRHPMNAHWGELVFGMKGELLPNFFFGWSLRAKFPLVVTNDQNIKPYIIPGLGKTGNGTPFDFSVTVSYRFPIFKTKTIPKPISIGGAKHPGLNEEMDPNSQDFGGSGGGGGYNRGR